MTWHPALRTLLLSLITAAVAAGASSLSFIDTPSNPSCEFFRYGMINESHLRLFVADLPDPFSWQGRHSRWKPTARSAYTNCSMEAPFGQPIEGHDAWNTNQFCAGMWFHRQLTSSPLRVQQLEDADIVYVPLFALDLQYNEWNHERERAQYITLYGAEWEYKATVKAFYQQAYQLFPALGSKPHIIVLPRVQQCYNAEGSLLDRQYADTSRHFTFLTIEASKVSESKMATHNVLTVPYPSLIHWRRANVALHQQQLHLNRPREILVYGTWSPRTWLRKSLAKQCAARNSTLECHVLVTRTFAEEQAIAAVALARHSLFCMQPEGDTYSRRSLYTCLAAGAVPVVFDSQWMHLLPFADVLNAKDTLLDLSRQKRSLETCSSSIVDVLNGMQQQRRHDMFEYVAQRRHLFQYMLDPVHELLTVDDEGVIHCFDDAFTASIKAVIRNACRRGLMPQARCGSALQAVQADTSNAV